jgi:hypothetical protein
VSRYIVATQSFDASHRDPDESPHRHGHTYHVAVTEQTEVRSPLPAHLADICAELHLRDLDEMLVGGSSTGPGIASWVLERLLINHPKITRVEVWTDPSLVHGVTREIR